MYERIVEIIVFVIDELKQNKNINDIDFKRLKKLGYTETEISTAFSWLVDRIEFSDDIFMTEGETNRNSFRILHKAEREAFTKEAYSELLKFQTAGIISHKDLELLLDHVIARGETPITAQYLKNYIAGVVFNLAKANGNGMTKFMLIGRETIH